MSRSNSSLLRSRNSKNIIQNPRCQTKEYKFATETDIDKLKEFEVNTKEIKELLKGIEKSKKEKEKADFEKKQINPSTFSSSSSLNKLSNKEKKKINNNTNKRNIRMNELEQSRKKHEDEENQQTKKMHKLLSEQIKTKTKKRIDKLLNNPTEERLEKVACTLRALLDVLKSGNCNLSQDSIRHDYQLKKIFADAVKANGGDENLAISFINVILEKNPDNNVIKFKNTLNEKNKAMLTSTIEKIQTCSA